MKSLRALAYCCERAFDGLRRHPATAGTVIGTIAVGFFLVGLVHVVFQMASAATGSWQRAHLVMYLADDVSDEQADGIRSAMLELPAVAQAEYIDSTTTMTRFAESLGASEALLEDVEPTMLPTSIEVTLRPGTREVAALAPVVERMRAHPAIADVEFTDEWTEQISAVQNAIDHARSLALLFALLACAYLASTAIAARFGPRLREASVARLFGASTAFVRAPLLLEGALQGAVGAGLAALGVYAFVDATAPGIGAVLGPAASVEMAVPDTAQLLGFVVAGSLLGTVSTWLATRRHASA